MSVLGLLSVAAGLWLLLSIAMACAWWVEQRTSNSGWIDVIWTCAMGLTGIIGATGFFSDASLDGRSLLIAALVFIWAARLGGHIAQRTTRISDDPRYAKLRAEWGLRAPRNMFWLLQAQAILSVPMVLSVTLAAWNPAPLFTPLDAVALALFCLALTGSAAADLQLTRFKQRRDTSGKVCDVGLWACSRHPNYFFEWLIWLSLALFAINVSGAWPVGYIGLLGPACIYWLLRYVSGVPPLEDHMVAKYEGAYTRYQERTSVFFPWPPKPPAAA